MPQHPRDSGPSAAPPLHRFDMLALHVELDAARELNWAQLAAETNHPFEGTTSLPIHPVTLRDIPTKQSVPSAVVLRALAWLKRTAESFLVKTTDFPAAPLPPSGPGRVLRFDTKALYAALDAERQSRQMTWRQFAAELPGIRAAMLIHLATGPLI